MAQPALNYAKDYSAALENGYTLNTYFGDLYSAPNNSTYRFVNADTIEMAQLTTTGRVDSDRDTITVAKRNYTNSWVPVKLRNERQWSTLVHPRDIDETNMVASITNITKTFNETQKFPEMDAYVASALFAEWTAKSKTAVTTTLTTANILDEIDKMILAFDNSMVSPTGRILYVTHETHRLIKNAEAIQRTLDVKTSGDAINRNVSRLDEVTIKPVPALLMKTLYDFTTGYAAAPTAKQINMFLIDPQAVITPRSYEFAQLDSPSAGSNGKYVYFEESHEDAFILPNKENSLIFHTEA